MVVGSGERRWGTWEELILGGAVLRHGTQDWNVVALELRSRTICPYYFTPEACKAKYEDLQKRYSGCNAWFEELRKRRVEELKRELQKSECSIGSLLTKIESLKAERERSAQIDYGSSHTESAAAIVKSEYIESFGKDGVSAGSFTLDTRTNSSHEFQSPAVASTKEIDSRLDCSKSCERDEVPSTNKPVESANGNGGVLRKRRGKRKRKDATLDSKEVSIGESDNVFSISGISTSHCKDTSTSCDQSIKLTASEDSKGGLSRLRDDDLMAIFNSITHSEVAMIFRHRHDSQKRARYKNTIRQHVDIETVRLRLANGSIKSAGELFRDLLLLTNNAIVYYSKRTREYKSAMDLRDIVTKAYRDHYKSSYHKATSSLLTFSTIGNLLVKPRSARSRPSKDKLQAKSCDNVNSIAGTVGGNDLKSSDADSEVPLQSLLAAKKGFKRRGKFKLAMVDESVNQLTKVPGHEATRPKSLVKEDHQSEMVTKERKRARKR
ncbi:PREDICTED: uncharacterized protein LOC109221746 isoform X1 [Nicotiana attenuata]|uniref:uncharacterized protein LOC109221746 isoform X1 n=1 Tax=Nicotiana attenuata TaxID=49451 RepID=UPI0009053B0D|nr:PREDICTED: uncharacterized protein LOC109221746 isoform X1 [Nicotiana attenuata]